MISKSEWEELKRKEKLLRRAANVLHTEDGHLLKTVKRFLREIEEMEVEIKTKA